MRHPYGRLFCFARCSSPNGYTVLAILIWAFPVGAADLGMVSKTCDTGNPKYNARTCICRAIELIAEESYATNVELQEFANEKLFIMLEKEPEVLVNELGRIKEKKTLQLVLLEFKSPISDLINLDSAKMALVKVKGSEGIKREIIKNIEIAEQKSSGLSIEIDWGYSGKRINGIQKDIKRSIDIGNYVNQQSIPYLLSGFKRDADIKIEVYDERNELEESIELGALKTNCYKIKKENGESIREIIPCIWD